MRDENIGYHAGEKVQPTQIQRCPVIARSLAALHGVAEKQLSQVEHRCGARNAPRLVGAAFGLLCGAPIAHAGSNRSVMSGKFFR